MQIERVPRFRKNEWGACFYDDIKTIAYYYGEDYELLALKSLRFNIDLKKTLWSSLVFNDPLFYNLNQYIGLNLVRNFDVNSLIKKYNKGTDALAIIEVASFYWPGSPDFKNPKKRNAKHYIILGEMFDSNFSFVDPYYKTKHIYNIDILFNAFQSYYEVRHVKHQSKSIRYIQNNILKDVKETLKDLYIMQKQIKVSSAKKTDVVDIEEVSMNFADGMELYLAMLEKYFPTIINTSIMNDSIRMILRWQNIRKNWVKNWDLKNVDNRMRLNNEGFSIVDSMINIFKDIILFLREVIGEISSK